MNKSNCATPIAVLIAGAMISAAVYFKPTQVRNAQHGSDAAASNIPEDEGQELDPLIRAMHGDGFVPLELDGWDAPADGVLSKEDLRRILDAWEKYWFESNDHHLEPSRDHQGII